MEATPEGPKLPKQNATVKAETRLRPFRFTRILQSSHLFVLDYVAFLLTCGLKLLFYKIQKELKEEIIQKSNVKQSYH